MSLDLARRLRIIRGVNMWTLDEMADACQSSRQAVHNWETGDTEPKAFYIGNLAGYTGISADWILGVKEGGGPCERGSEDMYIAKALRLSHSREAEQR